MVPLLRFSALAVKHNPETLKRNREKSQEMVARFNEIQADIERICKEKGLSVPVLM